MLPSRPSLSTERREQASALRKRIFRAAETVVAAMPEDPELPDAQLTPGEEIGRVIGLALAAGKGPGGEQLSPLALLTGLGWGYGEWLRGETNSTVDLTIEYFNHGVEEALNGLTEANDFDGDDDGDDPEDVQLPMNFKDQATVSFGLRATDLIADAETQGIAENEAAQSLIKAILSIAGIFSRMVGDEVSHDDIKSWLETALDRAALDPLDPTTSKSERACC